MGRKCTAEADSTILFCYQSLQCFEWWGLPKTCEQKSSIWAEETLNQEHAPQWLNLLDTVGAWVPQ